MKRFPLMLGSASWLVMAAGSLGFVAHAQDAEPEADQTRTFEKVFVTAQKREESLQDVPIVVTAIDGELLEDAGVRDIKDLTILTPGLLVTSTSNEAVTTARIRGVGTVGDNPGLESSVGVVVDGVIRARNGVGFGDLGELERVEVLKGPQGTLFGKSTSAGVINVITKAPDRETAVGASLTGGNYGLMRADAYINGALAEGLYGRVYGVRQTRDGYLDINTAIGPRTETEDNTSDYWSIRGQILAEPTETVTLRFIADFSERDEFCCAAPVSFVGPTAPLVNGLAAGEGTATTSGTEYNRLAFSNRDTEQQISDRGVSLQVDWETGFGDLTSITAWRYWNLDAGQDTDFSGADIWYRNVEDNQTTFRNFTQELRLADSTENFDWLVGVFYSDEDLELQNEIDLGSQYYQYFAAGLLSGLPAVLGITPGNFLNEGDGLVDNYQQESRTWAVFTNNTWRATDQLSFTLGLRYTSDDKELLADYRNDGGTCATAVANQATLFNYLVNVAMQSPAQAQGTTATIVGNLCLPWTNNLYDGLMTAQNQTEEEVSGTLKGAYRLNDSILGYASYSRGYKAGGFNLDRSQSGTGQPDFSAGVIPVADTSFPAETVDSYEVGLKTNTASGRLSLNAAYFYQTLENFQLNTFLGTSFIVTSIPEVTSRGVDMDLRWAPEELEGFTFQGGITFAETQYGEFTPVNPALNNLQGARISFAPRWSGSAAVTYDHQAFGDWSLRWNLAARYTSDFNTGSDLDPRKIQDAFALVNARVTLYGEDKPFSIELWGQNITDEDYRQVGFNTPLQSGSVSDFLGAPQTYGITARVDF